MRLLLGAAMVTEDESESDELVLLKFHSNARIISAMMMLLGLGGNKFEHNTNGTKKAKSSQYKNT